MPQRRRYATRNELSELIATEHTTADDVAVVLDGLADFGVGVDQLVKIMVDVETDEPVRTPDLQGTPRLTFAPAEPAGLDDELEYARYLLTEGRRIIQAMENEAGERVQRSTRDQARAWNTNVQRFPHKPAGARTAHAPAAAVAPTGMDHSLQDVTIVTFLGTLRDAIDHLEAVQPAALREPLSLWLRAVAEQAVHERWTYLLGRPAVAVWNAARAILADKSKVEGEGQA